VTDHFARLSYDVWTLDNERYGHSDKHRDVNCDIATGADDLAAAAAYIASARGAGACARYSLPAEGTGLAPSSPGSSAR
jgi:hypothetical protein